MTSRWPIKALWVTPYTGGETWLCFALKAIQSAVHCTKLYKKTYTMIALEALDTVSPSRWNIFKPSAGPYKNDCGKKNLQLETAC